MNPLDVSILKRDFQHAPEAKLNDDEVENPGKVDEALWSKAKKASVAAFGKIKYPFVTYWYKKQGGKFS